jgi:hypothetical protein
MASLALFSTESLYDTSLATTTNSTQASTANAAQAAASQAATTPQQDSVHLSEAAQAKMLYQQGQSVSTIAASLGTTSKSINEELGIALEQAVEKTLEATLTAKA